MRSPLAPETQNKKEQLATVGGGVSYIQFFFNLPATKKNTNTLKYDITTFRNIQLEKNIDKKTDIFAGSLISINCKNDDLSDLNTNCITVITIKQLVNFQLTDAYDPNDSQSYPQ